MITFRNIITRDNKKITMHTILLYTKFLFVYYSYLQAFSWVATSLSAAALARLTCWAMGTRYSMFVWSWWLTTWLMGRTWTWRLGWVWFVVAIVHWAAFTYMDNICLLFFIIFRLLTGIAKFFFVKYSVYEQKYSCYVFKTYALFRATITYCRFSTLCK